MNKSSLFILTLSVSCAVVFSGCDTRKAETTETIAQKTHSARYLKARNRDVQRIDSLEALIRDEVRAQKNPDVRLTMYTIQGYEYFAADYPADSLSPEYMFKAAQLYDGVLGRKNRAIEIYEKLYEKYPEYDKRGFALFVTGNLYHELNDTTKAVQALQKFVSDYPNHQFAGDARSMISYIRMDDKTRGQIFSDKAAEKQANKPL